MAKEYEVFRDAVYEYEDAVHERDTQIEDLMRINTELSRDNARLKQEADEHIIAIEEDEDFAPTLRRTAGSDRVTTALARSLAPHSTIGISPTRTLPYPYARILPDNEKPKQFSTLILHYGTPITPEAMLEHCRKDQAQLTRYAVSWDPGRRETVVAQSWVKRKSAIGAKTFSVNNVQPLVALPARGAVNQAYEYVESQPNAVKWGEMNSVSDHE